MKASVVVLLLVVCLVPFALQPAASAAPALSTSVGDGSVPLTVPKFGISFRLPPGWTSSAWDPGFETYRVTLIPPADAPDLTRVDFTVMSFEIPDGVDLRTWSKDLNFLLHGPEETPEFIAEGVSRDADGHTHQWLHERTDMLGPVQRVYVTHGRLVFIFMAYNHTDTMVRVLEDLAVSLSFTPDAPRSLNELWGTTDARWSLAQALDFRTGHPDPEGCGLVCQDAKDSQSLKPGPAPTPSEEYLRQEEEWLEWLNSHERSSTEADAPQVLG